METHQNNESGINVNAFTSLLPEQRTQNSLKKAQIKNKTPQTTLEWFTAVLTIHHQHFSLKKNWRIHTKQQPSGLNNELK